MSKLAENRCLVTDAITQRTMAEKRQYRKGKRLFKSKLVGILMKKKKKKKHLNSLAQKNRIATALVEVGAINENGQSF